ncbi:hypothetical protein KY314_04880, partial [Candidatus Woesearchaeota archaeon]|nr:hypothetical protein [Candidatus Woesearchaeota archaeon]
YMVIGPKIDIGPLSFFMFSRFVPILVAVAVFVLIIWYVQSGSSDDSKDHEQSPVSSDDSRRSKQSPTRKSYSPPSISSLGKVRPEVAEKIKKNPEEALEQIGNILKNSSA